MAHNLCLIVIDGWGVCEKEEGNAVTNAHTPVMKELCQGDKYICIDAAGLPVGLPAGLMGNSEVGHLNIGAGRVVYQDIVRINMTTENKKFLESKNFVTACENAKKGNGRLHFLGLVSDGGVHSHITHLFEMLESAKRCGVPNSFIHFFSDGRDTRPISGVTYIQQVLDKIEELKYGALATITGRYYAMDRDKRYERTKIAFECLVQGIGEKTTPAKVVELVQSRYDRGDATRETDEFLKPILVNEDGKIKDGDTLVFFDFRADRMRQIVEALGIKPQFDTTCIPKNLYVTTMTKYKAEFPFPILFPPELPSCVLAEWLSSKGIPQYHVAETEKYAHVTFFFNGGIEKQFPLEDRKLVPSPKVATYDLKPEMSSEGVADEVIAAIESGKYPFIMCNFAPPDMVGHTGNYEAAVKACEATDIGIGRIKKACEEHSYVLLVTADHGNAEQMISEKGGPHTAHTSNQVPFCITGKYKFRALTHKPALCDVAPTILDLMNVEVPKEMTGQSLVTRV